jgi:hypothetical protein
MKAEAMHFSLPLRDSCLHFILHVYEDFDEDLLFDAIRLLE